MSEPKPFDLSQKATFEALQRLLEERGKLSPEEVARRQPEFEGDLHRRIQEFERSLVKGVLERLDKVCAGLVIEGV